MFNAGVACYRRYYRRRLCRFTASLSLTLLCREGCMPTAHCLQRDALPPSSPPPEFLVAAGASLVHLPFDRSGGSRRSASNMRFMLYICPTVGGVRSCQVHSLPQSWAGGVARSSCHQHRPPRNPGSTQLQSTAALSVALISQPSLAPFHFGEFLGFCSLSIPLGFCVDELLQLSRELVGAFLRSVHFGLLRLLLNFLPFVLHCFGNSCTFTWLAFVCDPGLVRACLFQRAGPSPGLATHGLWLGFHVAGNRHYSFRNCVCVPC